MRIYEIKNSYQHIRLIDHGATIYEWLAFSDKTSIMLNNHDLEVYRDSKAGYFGSTVGRVANRIKNASFKLNGKTYELAKNNLDKHNLHGGPDGFNIRIFDVIEQTDTKIKFKYISPNMEMGFPGEVTLYITYELHGPKMVLTYDAESSEDTILNLTNHGHFNLGDRDILGHRLLMDADRILEVDSELIPTGKIIPVKDTPYDFQKETYIGEQIKKLNDMNIIGIDNTYLFSKIKNPKIELSFGTKKLTIETSYPGFQVYSVNRKFKQLTKDLKDIPLYGGIAFECQYEPDAINHENFSDVILRKGKKYHQFISYTLEENI
ncbi:galactose mutarotase [Acholeplasma equirhinis]|uniref:aldose epimerase family protein n=1 Tax=Acholeplasma equirhinis TaxID=555393 RepID=UPI00197AE8E6|nr:aldose epimerase family protein [Acholeplasma equirhinis]MBN3490749.1 galactose mutarotase [Acholeplasma equirhinis]